MTNAVFSGVRYVGSLPAVMLLVFGAILWSPHTYAQGDGTRNVEWLVLPGESVDDVVSQLGMSVEELCSKMPKWDGEVRGFETLPVELRSDLPVRALVSYGPKSGETVRSVAERFNMPPEWLRMLNHIPEHVQELGTDSPLVVVTTVDTTNQGVDENGDRFSSRIRQPTHIGTSPWFQLKRAHTGWGTINTVLLLRKVASELALKFPGASPLVFGDISQKWGGRLAPHASHRRGNDIDITVPRVNADHQPDSTLPGQVDIGRTWELIRSLVASGSVEYVFLDYRLQKSIYEFAVAAGLSEDTLAAVFQYPKGRGHRSGIIRHARGHSNHIHVRFAHDRQNLSTVAVDELSTGDGVFSQSKERDAIPGAGRTAERRGRCLVGSTAESNAN